MHKSRFGFCVLLWGMLINSLLADAHSSSEAETAFINRARTAAPPVSNNCENAWRPIGYEVAPFPETNAQYLSYQFRIPKGQKLALRIDSEFPVARYMSYHVYDQETEQSSSSLLDSEIVPMNGSVNPYQPGIDRYSINRKYGIWATCEGEKAPDDQPGIKLPCSDDKDRLVDIWYRVYVNEGNLATPHVTAYDSKTTLPILCPPLYPKEFSMATSIGVGGLRIAEDYLRGRIPEPLKSGKVSMYYPNSTSLGANDHNTYLTVRLDGKALSSGGIFGRAEKAKLIKQGVINNIGDVTVLKFKVPKFPDTGRGLKSFSGNEDVRYWSLCVSGEDTSTSNCLMDADTKTIVGEDGEKYAIVLVGPEDASFQAEAEKRGFNYLNHSKHRTPILFYRQMLARPDFAGKTTLAKRIDAKDTKKTEEELTPFFGETALGAYAPKGKQCWKTADFFDKLCGFEEIKPLLKKD